MACCKIINWQKNTNKERILEAKLKNDERQLLHFLIVLL